MFGSLVLRASKEKIKSPLAQARWLGLVYPVIVALPAQGMGFHVGDEFLRGQPDSAGALGVAGGGLLGWLFRTGNGWWLSGFQDTVDGVGRDRRGVLERVPLEVAL